MNLPKPYQDCVIEHKDGTKRIARLSHDSNHWQLSTYQIDCKHQYAWKTQDVVSWKLIEY